MEKIAYVKVKYEDVSHKIPATDTTEERGQVIIYNGTQVVGRFDLDRVESWALELASD